MPRIKVVRGYKILGDDLFSLYPCATEGPWIPAEWRTVDGELIPGRNGIHYCRRDQLVGCLGPTIWTFEDGSPGDSVPARDGMLTRRGRIIQRLDRWRPATAVAFAADCADNAIAHLFRQPRGRRERKAWRASFPGVAERAIGAAREVAIRLAEGSQVPDAYVEDALRSAREAIRSGVESARDLRLMGGPSGHAGDAVKSAAYAVAHAARAAGRAGSAEESSWVPFDVAFDAGQAAASAVWVVKWAFLDDLGLFPATPEAETAWQTQRLLNRLHAEESPVY